MTGPVTIANLIRDWKLIEIGCTACGHRFFIADDLELPDHLPVPEVYRRCRCSKCGVKGQGYTNSRSLGNP